MFDRPAPLKRLPQFHLEVSKDGEKQPPVALLKGTTLLSSKTELQISPEEEKDSSSYAHGISAILTARSHDRVLAS